MMDLDMASASEPQEERIGPETLQILQRVYDRLKYEEMLLLNPGPRREEPRLLKLTGMNAQVITRLTKGASVPIDIKQVDRRDILNVLHTFYLKQKCVPTTMMMFSACHSFLPMYFDIHGFRKLLFKYDFVWKKLPHYTFVILERPSTTHERFQFLKSILADSLDVCFVEENAYTAATYHDYHSSLKSESSNKIIYTVCYDEIIYNSSYKYEYTEESFKDYILNELMPKLHKPHIIVFSNAEHHCEMLPGHCDLTIESLKCEMTDWLDVNNIPYDKTMSKVELFSLIETCTNNYMNKYVVDELLLSNGHLALRLPNHLYALTPGQYISSYMKMKMEEKVDKCANVSALVTSLLTSIEPICFNEAFRLVFAEYRRMFDEDLQVDQSIDGLFLQVDRFTADANFADSDVPSLSDTDDEY